MGVEGKDQIRLENICMDWFLPHLVIDEIDRHEISAGRGNATDIYTSFGYVNNREQNDLINIISVVDK